jgi:hypothetical protein
LMGPGSASRHFVPRRVRDTDDAAPPTHAIVSGDSLPATRFSAGVVFRSFTLFATFSLYGHAGGTARGLRKPVG